ncbi:MAG: Ig-like domain-containing protein [Candidatus Absconditabacteria bacterium]|nr:Ig-like domain-containing protein [Candidatus Absconditabacteria bacterium]
MKKTKEHIIHHTKRLAAHGQKVVHHSAKIAHKHRHILLGYMHVCLVVIGMYVFHMATSMYAQENGETIISQKTMSMENILTQETDVEEISIEELNTEEIITEINEEKELTGTVNEDSVLTGVTNNNEITQTGSDLTGNIEPALTGAVIASDSEAIQIGSKLTGAVIANDNEIIQTGSELTGAIESELTGTVESDLTGTIESALTGTVIASDSEAIQTGSTTGELILPEINNPSDINGLQTWLDANKIESIELSGNYVTLRKDRRGFASKAFSPEENKMPSLVPGVVNNLSAIYFDNIDDGMQTNIKLNSEYTLFIIYNKEHTPINFSSAIGSNSNWFIGFQQDNFGFFATGLINIPTPRAGNNFKVVAVQANNSGTQVFLNNQNVTLENPTILPTQELTLGNISDQKTLGGYIAEIIVYEKTLGEYEMTKIQEYFQRKYSPFTSIGAPTQTIESQKEIIFPTENQNNSEEDNCDNLGCEEELNNDIVIQNNESEDNNSISTEEIKNDETQMETENNGLSGNIEDQIENIGLTGNNKEETINSELKFSKAFKKNQENEMIGALQEFLIRYGTYQGEITNIYDEITIEAIYQFQLKEDLLRGQQNNRSIYGYLGPSTRKRINQLRKDFVNSIYGEANNNEEQEEINEGELTGNIEDEIIDIGLTGDMEGELDIKERFKRMLLGLGYQEEINKGKEMMRGKKGFKLEISEGIIPISTTINKNNESFIGEITFPEEVIIKTETNDEYTGDILFFDIEENNNTENGIKNIKTFKAGADEPIFLEDDLGNPKNATIKISLPENTLGEKIIIRSSQDGNIWEYLDTVETSTDGTGVFANFQTNHFTIFSLGIWTGSFVINNDEETITGYNVTLTTNITGATHMKFGNTPTERDSASRITYNDTYPRTLAGADGEKTVYAMFSGNGTVAYIQDTIYLDTSSQQPTELQLYLDGSYNGNIFYDLSQNNYLATSINNVFNSSLGGLPTMGFNGTNNYIEINQPIVTNYPFTISAWVKPDRITGTQGIVLRGRNNTNNRYYGINLNNATFQATARNTTARTANGTISAQIGQRYHIVGIFDGDRSRTIYINTVQGATNTSRVKFDTTTPHRTVGKYPGTATNYFSGEIDEVRIYNKSLTTTEIQALYITPPIFQATTQYISNPIIQGFSADKNMNIEVVINGNTYPATNTNGIRKSYINNPMLSGGTYDVTLNYTNIYGATGSTTFTNALTINPIRSIIYSPDSTTFGSVTATLNGLDNNFFITNNNGSNQYIFDTNGDFVFEVQSTTGLQYKVSSTVNRIQKGNIDYSTGIFYEDEDINNGSIINTITAILTGDTFSPDIISNNLIKIENLPLGLTGNYTPSGNNQIIIALEGNAISHTSGASVNSININFLSGAFSTYNPSDIGNSIKTDIQIQFIDGDIIPGQILWLDGNKIGNNFLDLSQNNKTTTGINNIGNSLLGTETIIGPFNGTNQYIEVGNYNLSTYTISAWFNSAQLNNGRRTIIGDPGTSFEISQNTSNQIEVYGVITSNTVISANTRYHVTLVVSPTQTNLYINGEIDNSNTTPKTINSPLTVGMGYNGQYRNGSIDEVMIYNIALDTQQIQDLYMKKPSFSNTTSYIENPTLKGTSPDSQMTINVVIDGNTYPATNNQDGTRTVNGAGPFASGTYDVTLNYTNVYGATGSTIFTNALTINPIRSIIYSPDSTTFGNVTATLTGLDGNHTIINNSGSPEYIFTENGNFTYQVQNDLEEIIEVTATVDRIQKGFVTGSNLIFYEDEILNNGGIQNTINFQISGDTFDINAPTNGSITMSGVPAGLTPNYYLSGTQTLIVGLSGTATNHANINDINNIEIRFGNGAFTNSQENEIQNSTITDIRIDFLDPYVGLQLYPSDDTMIDADTDVANGCGDGVCQEYNFGSMQYICASDFGSKILMKFDPSSIPTGSKITSAKLRLSRYYINTQTPGMSFSLRPVINNFGWVEGNKSNTKATAGEVNYKMLKREQESWFNGNIGMVNGVDYGINNMTSNPEFTGPITTSNTQEFDFNSYGISRVQNWLDNPETNQGIMIGDSNDYWLCVRSKEFGTISNRPMMTVTYAIDTDSPEITSISPYNNETNVGLYNNLIINFNENIRKHTGYNITIKRLHDNSIFQTIDAGSQNVTINNNVVTIGHGIPFENYTGYYIEIQSGAFRDVAGNSFPGFVGLESWRFTTVNTQVVPAITGNTATNVGTNSALATATITSTGSANITERGFYRSLTNGFNDGMGTKVSEVGNRNNLEDFSLTLTGLPSGTWIYFKGFATNSYGSKFTQQSGFLTLPAKPILKPATYIDNDGFRINRETTTGATSYKLRVSTGSSFYTTLPGYSGKTITDIKENLIGLQKETRYYYKLQAINNAGQSEMSNTQSTQTTWLPAPWSWLKLEETSGSTTFDSSLNNNYGILLGGVTMNQAGIDGKAFQFDGVNDELSIVDFDHGPDLTVSFRFKTNSTNNNMYLYSHGDSTATNSINVVLNNSDQTLKTFINGQQTILNLNSTIYNTITDNERHLYTLTINDDGEIAGKKKATVYIDGQEKISNSSIDSGIYNPTNNITLARRSTNQANTFYQGMLDDIRIYNKTLTSGQVYNLYAAFIDTIPPTAYIEYSPGSGTCYNGDVVATLTGASEPIVITNNGGSNTYTFTENNTFTFTFRDAGFNTGEATATVDWICKDPVNIGGPAMVNANIQATNDLQIVEQEFSDYFRIEDPIGANNGYYTTIAISDLSGQYQSISKNTIAMKSTDIIVLSGTTNPRVEINSNLSNYQSIGEPITYIKRDTASNFGVKGKYGNKPWLKFDIPAYVRIDEYKATLTYTLYEN